MHLSFINRSWENFVTVAANDMFRGMTVQAKKVGKGMRKSTIPIDDLDL